MTCDTIREQLFDYVYDACEDDVAVAINAHLQNCAGCAAALEAVKGDRSILAEAAAVEAPGFAVDPHRTGRPELRPARPLFKRWWFQAAAALFVFSVSLLGYRTYARGAVVDAHPTIAVGGPSVLPAGAPVEFNVTAANPYGTPRHAELSASVFNADGSKAGDAEVVTTSLGHHTVRVPADLGRPGEFMALQINAGFGGEEAHRVAVVALRDRRNLLARVSTDKPLYRPGEIVRARLQALERFRLTPAGSVPMSVRLENPKGETIQQTLLPSERGVSAWTLGLPADAVGGEWTIVLTHPQEVFPEVRRTFIVRNYQPPRLKKAIELDKDSYAPGATGAGWLTVERAEGGVPAGAACTAVVTIDGSEVYRKELQLGASGGLNVPFELPETVEAGRGLLAVTIRDGGVVETATKTIPITLDRLDVVCFPEGGELVAGLANRVYFEVRDPLGEPADAVLQVQDSRGLPVGGGNVEVRGMGTFTFKPAAGERYQLVALKPEGVQIRGEIPPVVADGVTLRARDLVVAAGAPVRCIVGSAQGGQYEVQAWCRGSKVGAAAVGLTAGESKAVELTRTADAGGVLRLTVFDASGTPVAERLVNAEPPHRITVEVTPERTRYLPGETVKATIRTTDENGTAIPAVAGVVVVDEAVLSYAQDRDTPDLPLHFLLGLEVEELEEVQLYAEGARATRAVDLLLGVQGWRRFAWKESAEFVANHPDSNSARAIVAAPLVESAQPISFSSANDSAWRLKSELRQVDRMVTGIFFSAILLLFVALIPIGLAAALWFIVRTKTPNRRRRIATSLAVSGGAFGLLVLLMGFFMFTAMGGNAAPKMARDMAVAMGAAPMTEDKMEAEGWEAGGDEDPMAVPEEELLRAHFAGMVDHADVTTLSTVTATTLSTLQKELDEAGRIPRFLGDFEGPSVNLDGGVGLAAAGLLAGDSGMWVPADHRGIVLLEGREALTLTLASDLPASGEGKAGYFAAGKFFQQRAKVLVREYRHEAKERPQDGSGAERTDFAEVLYWNPMLVTGADGTAVIEFDTCDSITSFTIGVEANDARGALAAGAGSIENRVPFYLEPKLPTALSAGDQLLLPVAVVNDTRDAAKVTASVDLKGPAVVEGGVARELQLAPEGRGRLLFPVTAQQGTGELQVRIAGTGPLGMTDKSQRSIRIQPRGYPMTINGSGVIEKVDRFAFAIPAGTDLKTLSGGVKVYPSMLATLVDGLDGMLQMPGGCFEQASSTNYPNVLALTYMAEGDNIVPAVARRSRDYLDKGYDLLTSYECSKLGYEWFGKDPGHAALTAYGLIEFHDMQQVFDVDPTMIQRTKGWVLDLRDGSGGFTRVEGDGHSFGMAPADTVNAYITWVLTEAAPELDVTKELDNVERLGRESEDPYILALAAAALQNAGRASAKDVLAKLAAKQEADGSLMSTGTSITHSGGDNLRMETTAFATLAFLKDARFTAQAESAIRWMLDHRKGSGRFGSTQATIMALKALVTYAKDHRRAAVDHDITVLVNGKTVHEQHLAAGTPGVLKLERVITAAAREGANVVEIRTTGSETLPWAAAMTYRTTLPPSDERCAVRVATTLAKTTVAEGEAVGCKVVVTNTRDAAVPMTLARIGLPAGLEPRLEQLKELQEQGVVGFYETREREVTLYWRGLGPKGTPKGTRELNLDLVARIPGTFEGPATSAYLYYDDDAVTWAAPLTVRIVPSK